MIPLIQKQDGFEFVRDKICIILAAEVAHQMELAEEAESNPDDLAFKVYRERFNPWDVFRHDTTPLVNVWYDGGTTDDASSTRSLRQKWSSRYNLDVYAYAKTKGTDEGHNPGDELAAVKAHHVAKLVRNIIMHDDNRQLQITGDYKPWKRSITNISTFQPQSNGRIIENVYGLRLMLEVDHNEMVSLAPEETLENVYVDFMFAPDGQVIAEADYIYTGEEE